MSPHQIAIQNGNLEIVQYLNDHGAIFKPHSTPNDMILAVYSGNLELVQFLIEREYNLNFTNDENY